MLIATHNSATGERGKGLLSWLVTPFSRCQSKTIAEQYRAGCRYYDIRIRRSTRGWICAHGMWTSRRTVADILKQINGYGDCCVSLTHEGKDNFFFEPYVEGLLMRYPDIAFTSINVKKPKWHTLKVVNDVHCKSQYKILDGSSWHTLLPIPWLWKKAYYNRPKFNNSYFSMVDFL